MQNPFFSGRWLSPLAGVYLLVHLLLIAGGYVMVQTPSHTIEAVGASLIAAGITGIVVFVYIRFSQDAADRLKVISDFGIVTAFEARAARIKKEYDRRILIAREIDVMGFGLNALREDYREQFTDWAQRCRVRILLVDPNYPEAACSYARQREEEEGDRPGSIEGSVNAFLTDTAALRGAGTGERFQVRLYRSIPALNICRVDEELFWGPYLVGGPSRNNPTIIVKKGGIMFDRLMNHFNMVWEKWSKPA
jgi:hypothetical protein